MEKLKNIKEKTKNLARQCKGVCVNFCAKCVPFFNRGSTWIALNKKKILIGSMAIIVLIGVGVSSFYLLQWLKYRNESPIFTAIRKAELAGSGKVGSKIIMGDLEISLIDTIEGTYRPLEVDEEFRRVPPRGYFGARVMIFNTSYNQKEFLLFGLTDDLGNQYERDQGIDFYIDGARDFGPAREIYPRTIRGGEFGKDTLYVFFPAFNPDAKKFKLTVMSETTNKKVVFDIDIQK